MGSRLRLRGWLYVSTVTLSLDRLVSFVDYLDIVTVRADSHSYGWLKTLEAVLVGEEDSLEPVDGEE